MQTQAAVLFERNTPWSVETIELDAPKATEVLIELHASGMCHSDDHLVTGDMPIRLPCIGGHEGAGVVKSVGEHVSCCRRATMWCSASSRRAGGVPHARQDIRACATWRKDLLGMQIHDGPLAIISAAKTLRWPAASARSHTTPWCTRRAA